MTDSERIVFVNRFFYPDISATAQILGELVFVLAEKGRNITVLTSRSAYDSTEIEYPESEHVKGVHIIRVGRNRFKRTNYAGRLVDLAGFYLLLTVRLFKIIKATDVLVCKTDPPLLLVVGGLVKKIKKCRLISWNQDLFPEVAAIYFRHYPVKLVYPFLKYIRDSSLRLCDRCIVISAAMQAKLKALGVDRIVVITNWGKAIFTDQQRVFALKKQWKIEHNFVIEYSGNFGFVHDYETIKQTIELLQHNTAVVFLFIGSGKHYESLKQYAQQKNLNNVIFKPYQPPGKLSDSLSVGDIHLITFKPEMEGLVFPSKFYSICAAARPILFIGDRQSELAGIINSGDCGQCFDVGHSQQAADYITQISADPEQLARQGENARKLFESNYTLGQAEVKWRHALDCQSVDLADPS